MEFDTVIITGIVILSVFFVVIIIWVLSRKDEEEYPKQRKWRI